MVDLAKRLFVGIKISEALQLELDGAAPGTKHYFDGNGDKDYLQIVSMGEEQFVGRYIKDGFSAAGMTDASRNICSIVKLIARGRNIDERDVHIYAC
ncbi:MAG: hypothetical protein EXR70_12935 [Deltaproteobacteria bacterium]|nr:hypothetical protein [Deltaproteobacteria bacterium]